MTTPRKPSAKDREFARIGRKQLAQFRKRVNGPVRKPSAKRLPRGVRRIPGYIVTRKCGHEWVQTHCSIARAKWLASTPCDGCRLIS